MLRAVDAGDLPARVREVYVFGSYARGAPKPGDLDLLVIHDDPGKEYWSGLEKRLASQGHGNLQIITLSAARFHGEMRRKFRRPGESVDIILARNVDEVLGPHSKIERSELVLLWSLHDRDFGAKLQAIRPDPAAGRAPRDHLLSMKRFNDHVETMERVVEMVADGRLTLTRVPVVDIDLSSLNAHHKHWLDWWTQCKVMGRKSLELLPYGMWWLQQHRQRAGCPHQLEMYSKSGTHRVHLGRPSLGWMLGVFSSRPRLQLQCLIPHLSGTDPNELLAFERGPKWEHGR
jgi:predicted nucleotidyltransferase